MNKRQRKKEVNKIMKKDVIYLKLYICENDRYNPEIKCRGFRQFLRRALCYRKKYKCDIGFYNPLQDESSYEGEKGED